MMGGGVGSQAGGRSQAERAGKSGLWWGSWCPGWLELGWQAPILGPGSALGDGLQRARGSLSSVLAAVDSKMPLSLCFCPQPRFWLRWP